ncbi:MotA/TolQ/ExbB proton channel family protein [Acidithiobacillus sp. 'AMD consortium']|jgi:biopolymer transport protein ExbB|uniref:Biopolymer transport protein ExbB n=2 Tax=Acidithiobacillus ferridurans TaxID=1232575 RepID=A0A2Z6IEV3_ACIFI|nr:MULTISPECIES: MotA/TolQ/ExbB proton channel family protein [Acidithiobacillus]MBU2715970.1 MotA/TolQ/ExbB proton channel family protein [Acidithiobacillus ferridurans]MBU2722981.1 MotA/TolQ/ExbB proton channel family protein [Acidithiobacillus ferridurans]MBU2726943.1 MotA/TolQ/ExbB proton channel family protein [Acidithiobacillus ferridurans]MBU2731272.1 MotA/TolQ/ExbB proton channel family protein [Acidithiobacillus ferridurans]MBU2803649.1 MotA/TolQ/ExbB proton channel family protein [Ac
MNLQYLIHLANYSDGVLYVLGALLLVELSVIVDRFWFLRRTILRGLIFVHELGSHGRLDRDTLNQMADGASDLPEASLLRMAASHHGQVKGEGLASRLEESVLVLAPQLDRRLWLLDTIITLAPLLGLFGTIIGMFHAFSVLATPGHAPTAVTGGVADALVATATGLFIAMLGLMAFNAFNNQVRQILLQLDSVKTMLINRMDGQPMITPDNGEQQRSEMLSVARAS